ncbi:AfsR/SARP family transcriptional regulator [Actinomadura roseirufa]|uniref:AfsR/SARP family transcriptional regulator n=1 Tax=Actinomadura roseirufa TaxID=2094049 RepID=UPI0013F14BB1|nr:AfsR/SARP family transcriptional regulator [Actinomadura roseirufa]
MRAEVVRDFTVLGTLRMSMGGDERIITASKERVIAGALLLHANETVPVDRLVEYVWEKPPRAARASLYSMVKRLRLSLGDHDVIRTASSGYVIETRPGELDLHSFQALHQAARSARERGETAVERERLGEALALWRGPALADVPSPALHHSLVPRLEELRLEAIGRQVELDLAAGRHVRLVGQLRELTREHPLREGFWSLLMLALYRCNRQAEALAAFHQVRRVLDAELGIEPGGELRDLYQRILRADPDLDPADAGAAVVFSPAPGATVQDAAQDAPPGTTGLTGPDGVPSPAGTDEHAWNELCQLPPAAADFVARDLERGLMVGHLAGPERRRVLVLWGPGGVGKTELAVQVAHDLRAHYPDGQWYVALNGTGGSPRPLADVLADLLIAVGVPAGRLPRSAEARAAVLRARISDRRVLLVLDDAADVAQVQAMLPGTASAAVLITSRSALGELAGARRHRLGSLSSEESVTMLRAALGEERVGEEIPAARELARRCSGMPRALRSVSARLHAQPGLGLGDLVRGVCTGHGHREEPGPGAGPPLREALPVRLGPVPRTSGRL